MIRQLLFKFLKEVLSATKPQKEKTAPSPESAKPEKKPEPPKNPPKTGAQIGQFMVTHTMRKELRDLGYTKFQIDALSPDDAASRIKQQKGPNG